MWKPKPSVILLQILRLKSSHQLFFPGLSTFSCVVCVFTLLSRQGNSAPSLASKQNLLTHTVLRNAEDFTEELEGHKANLLKSQGITLALFSPLWLLGHGMFPALPFSPAIPVPAISLMFPYSLGATKLFQNLSHAEEIQGTFCSRQFLPPKSLSEHFPKQVKSFQKRILEPAVRIIIFPSLYLTIVL